MGASGRLAGKVAVVTGASRGIGRAVALRFAEEGAAVVAGSRTPLPYEREGVSWVETDVADPEQARRLMDAAAERHGCLDVLVNNAGVDCEGSVETTSIEDWDLVFAVNVRGTFLCARYAIPYLRRSGGGSIVNLSSISGFVADPEYAAYCASKGAVINLTRSIAYDVGKDGIRCNCICPGYILTDMLDGWFDAQPDPAATRASAIARHPIGRMGQPGDIAALALWLASDEASFASGQVYVHDGGLTAGGTA